MLISILITWLVPNATPGESVYVWVGVKIVQSFIGGDAHFKTNGSKIHSAWMWYVCKNSMIK